MIAEPVHFGQTVQHMAPVSVVQMPAVQTMMPVTTVVPVSVVHPTSNFFGSDRRLLAGAVIGEQHVMRDDLIRQGRLIPDDEREMQLLHQASSMAGHMPHGHPVGMSLGSYGHLQQATQPIVANDGRHPARPAPMSYAAPTAAMSYGAPPATVTYGAPPAHVVQQDERLEISILHAQGLHHLNFTGDNLWACAEIVKHSGFGQAHKCQTATVSKNLNPEWNEMHHLDGYHPGDDLKFSVYDHGMIGSKTEGHVTILSQDFFPNGWEGQLPLQGIQEAFLTVRIVPLGLLSTLS